STQLSEFLAEKDQYPTILQQRQAAQQNLLQAGAACQMNTQNKFLNGPNIMHQSSASAPTNCFLNRSIAPNRNTGTFSPNSQKRVQDLNQERRSYRLRQEEIMKQGLLMDSTSPNPLSPGQNCNIDASCLPYGGQPSQIATPEFYHMRQESGDSGVGMMMPFVGGGVTNCTGGNLNNNNNAYSSSGSSSQAHTPENFLTQAPHLGTGGGNDMAALNIAGIDLNFGLNMPMEMDTSEDIPQLNPNELDQILNCRPPLRH
uniref:Uncharacterized protein n=1 Tax=Romanomermis culicivorax TaxID=13658 RepID=A0A915L5P5_ROMCU